MGKSALVHEIHKRLTARNGYFVEGKFDQLCRDTPYSALGEALGDLVKQALSEPDAVMQNRRAQLPEALGGNGQIVIDVIPSLETLIGEQKPVQELPATEARNRFLMTFKSFIQAFARKEHPLTIFLDDLQWSDSSTLELIKHLITSEVSHFLMIGAYRRNEVTATHPLQSSLSDIEKTRPLRHINVEPLDLADIEKLVASTIHRDPSDIGDLAALVYAKTHGNPFFAGELLRKLYHDGLLNFRSEEGRWSFSLPEIARMQVGDVVDLMLQRLGSLPADVREILPVAACIGNSFDLKTLAQVLGEPVDAIANRLLSAINDGIIVPQSDRYHLVHLQPRDTRPSDLDVSYRFQHDRIHEAAYAMLKERRSQLHLEIARLLQRHTPAEDLEEKVIEIVRHFNASRELLGNEQERRDVCLLNLRAARKAKRSNAHGPAFEYIKVSRSLLSSDPRAENDALDFDINREYADIAFLSGELDIAKEACEALLKSAKPGRDKAIVYGMLSRQHDAAGEVQAALDTGLQALSQFGIEIDKAKAKDLAGAESEKLAKHLDGRTVESLIDLPLLTDPEKKYALKLLLDLSTPAYVLGLVELYFTMVLKAINISLEYGSSAESSYAFTTYAVVLRTMGAFEQSDQYGQLALRLDEKLAESDLRCRVRLYTAVYVTSWSQPPSVVFAQYKAAIEHGIQSGDLVNAGYGCNMMARNPSLSVAEAKDTAAHYLQLARSIKHQNGITFVRLFQQYLFCLTGHTKGIVSLSSGDFDEEAQLADMTARKFNAGIASYYIIKLELFYMFDQCVDGLEVIKKADLLTGALMGSPDFVQYGFAVLMILSGAYPTLEGAEREEAMQRIKREQAAIEKLHAHYPVNMAHYLNMSNAQLSILAGDVEGAVASLMSAIAAAKGHGCARQEAMAKEALAKLYIRQGKRALATRFMTEACHDYTVWGATAKREFMLQHHGEHMKIDLGKPGTRASGQTATVTMTGDHGASIDMSTVIKAAQAISQEVVLKALLVKLMTIATENAGADRAFLFLMQEQTLAIMAKSLGDNVSIAVDAEKPDGSELALGIVNYVARSLDTVVMGSAADFGKFAGDSYIQRCRPKSVLCLPIVNQRKLIGVLYLENTIATNAFTPARSEILKVLAVQAAISIENALLYRTLEQKVEERTAQLRAAQQDLIDMAHRAGMSQIATMVIHNAGNILNTVQTNAQASHDHIKSSRLSSLLKVNELLTQNQADLASFLTADPRGKKVPQFYVELGQALVQEQRDIESGLVKVLAGVAALSSIIRAQQEYAVSGLLTETLPLSRIVDDTLLIESGALSDKDIHIIKDYDDVPMVLVQKSKLAYVLASLFANARESLEQVQERARSITVSIKEAPGGVVRLMISDNGIGIPAEIMDRIFTAGFSTKAQPQGDTAGRNNRGLGLHNCANFMREMRARLFATSKGAGAGATFVLEFSVTNSTTLVGPNGGVN